MLNRFECIGNLGRDPDMAYTQAGKAVCKFSVAVNNHRAKVGEPAKPEDTLWVNIVAWERLAETCNQYLHKGDKVYVAGRLQVRKFTRQDGTDGTSVEVVLSEMVMLTPRTETVTTGAAEADYPF